MELSLAKMSSVWREASRSFVPQRAPIAANRLAGVVREIRNAAKRLQDISDEELRRRANELRSNLARMNGLESDEYIIASFSLASEGLRRTFGFQYFDVQLMAGIALLRGGIAQMHTGEGKTIVAALPAFARGLTGQGVHVATTNPYLASRDAAQVTPILELLGLSVGLLPEQPDPEEASRAYRCDVTYGTGYQFGFDFLRDQITLRQHPALTLGRAVRSSLRGGLNKPKLLQRNLNFAVIDEIDSVLIDEANTPLILSEATTQAEPAENFVAAKTTITSLIRDEHFTLDPQTTAIAITKSGELLVFEALRNHNCQQLDRPWLQYIRNALRAEHVLARDIDYVVQDGEVRIVDQYTGRICPERKWSDGLHQAVEAKEAVDFTPPNNSSARITRQKYFRLYRRLCGMTGTATGSEREFHDVYGLAVAPIPLNRPSKRKILPPLYYANIAAKLRAIQADVRQRQQNQQPVLIGTRSIRDSQEIAHELERAGVPFVVLNGIQDETEAAIVSGAGQAGAVTIATNMAGRGTDIPLSAAAKQAGGLHVLATDYHESERVDRQLMGRCARQGDPGSYQMMASADDELFNKFAPELVKAIRQSADQDGVARKDFSAEVTRLQLRLLRESFERRLRLLAQDHWTETLLDTFLSET